MKDFLKKRLKGDSTFIATLLCLFLFIVVVTGSFYAFMAIVRIDNVKTVHRRYLGIMQRDGLLTYDEKNALLNELDNLGCINVDLTGTSFTEVGYGNQVRLSVDCTIVVDGLKLSGATFSNFSHDDVGIHIVVNDSITALY